MRSGTRILLIVTGGIAAYKSLELTRRLVERGAVVRGVLTRAAAHFVTPLSLATLSGHRVHQDLFSLTDESEIGHIRLARENDLVVVAPATADFLARMAAGLGDDLATTLLLATDRPVLVAPSMNAAMWAHPATQANMSVLEGRGVHRIGPGEGALACKESGFGRMADVAEILAAIEERLSSPLPLAGRSILVTAGPTYESIDPVRFIGNRSSGKQGYAIAAALAAAGAEVTLVSGPTALSDPPTVTVRRVESAREMLAACRTVLPAGISPPPPSNHPVDGQGEGAPREISPGEVNPGEDRRKRGPIDVAICAAAVADWRVDVPAGRKLKKNREAAPPSLNLVPNPDILAALSAPGPHRPRLVVGFAAETEDLLANAAAKRRRKGCDWILANDVSSAAGTFGSDENRLYLITDQGTESWPRQSKAAAAARLAARLSEHFAALDPAFDDLRPPRSGA